MRGCWILLVCLISNCFVLPLPASSSTVEYTVSFVNLDGHLLHVAIRIPPGASSHDLQLPVWNATYQVRDFAQYVNWIRANAADGKPLPVASVNKSCWRVSGADNGATIEYEIFANEPGPFGAEVNAHHAFFNLAEVLMYPVDARSSPMHVEYANVPQGWQAATALPGDMSSGFTAPNYDRLVDSPIELSLFREADFDLEGGHYRVVVDADFADYNLNALVNVTQRLVAAETHWMNDRPFDSFLFIYHFPHDSSGGGMEHAFSTAITLNASYIALTPGIVAAVTAHEFFHLWNVKRLIPQSLESVDYAKESYTRALWFSEGVTSTVEGYALLQANLIDEAQFLTRLSRTINELESRPARLTQSAEESSLDAWLEKYPYYGTPERSISYYNKGELLGILLDLRLRELTHDAKSLRDLFQWMNQNYAKQGSFFPDSDGVRMAAEALSGADFRQFFNDYVSGTKNIPWDDFFNPVGLHLVHATIQESDPEFTTRNFSESPVVVVVGSSARNAGLVEGDSILEINGQTPDNIKRKIDQLKPGDTIYLKVRNQQGNHELHWKLRGRERDQLELKDVDHITSEQRLHRMAWLRSTAESPGAKVQ